jgi:hypothetical protein
MPYNNRMMKWATGIFASIVGLGLVAIVVLILIPKPPIPDKIKADLTSSLLLPETSNFPISAKTVKYDSGLKLLSFDTTVYGDQVIVSEQPTPESFTDVPAVYAKVLDGMTDYDDFDVNVGTVHLTTPPQLNGKQAAVLNTKGTLLFAKPSRSLTNSQWQQFFTSFDVDQ